MTKKVLFICLGNICRSPIAEAVFINLVKKNGEYNDWEIDSAAIGSWHIGKSPDQRAITTMQKYKLEYSNKARQIRENDFRHYDYIFGMDDENMSSLDEIKPADAKAKLLLLGEFDPEGERIIRDPYYDRGAEGFKKCYEQCVRCCESFYQKVKKNEI